MKKESNFAKFDPRTDIDISSENYLYEGFLKVKKYLLKHRRFEGHWSPLLPREVVERRAVAAALPYDPVLDQVILIQQFRVGALSDPNPWLLEIVAGLMEATDSSIEELIRREIREESGLVAMELHKINEFWLSPGGSDEFVTFFWARVDSSNAGGIHGVAHEAEDIFVHVMKADEAFNLVSTGQIRNAITIMALQWLQLNRDALRKSYESP